MPMRPLRVPQDLIPTADMLVKTFQYPDHPEWGVQSDEQEQIVTMIRRVHAIWPAIRALQLFSPTLRDTMRGFVWEENGVLGGLTVAEREGTTALWNIGTIGVLPEFRRRGIARQLVIATLDMMRQRGGTQVTLGVIDGNTPAQSLYRSLGFAEYRGSTRYALTPSGQVEVPALPNGYRESSLAKFDWRTRLELDQRLVPAQVQTFEPVIAGRYRTPGLLRVLAPLLRSAQNVREGDIAVRRTGDGVVVARAGWTITKGGKGTNTIRIRLDPAHPDLAPYLVHRALYEALAKRPDLRVEIFVASWMPAVAQVAEELGFVRRTSNKAMGLKL